MAVVLVGGGLVLAPVNACWACSCAAATPAEQATRADVALLATVVEVDDSAVGNSSGDPVHYVLSVEGVQKGSAPSRVVVDSVTPGGSCGLEGIRVGDRYLVLARGAEGGGLTSGLCDGTVPLASGPAPAAYGLAAPVPPTTVQTTATPSDSGGAAGPADSAAASPWPWALGALVVGVGATAFAARGGRRERRDTP